MKLKILLLLVLSVCLISFVSATDYQLVYANKSATPSGTSYIQPTNNKYNANNFTINASYDMAIIELVSANSNAGSCDIYLELWDNNAGDPGSLIAGATASYNPTSGLDFNYNFTFASPVTLPAGNYWMVAWINSDSGTCYVGSPRGADTVNKVSSNLITWNPGAERLSFRLWAEIGEPEPTTTAPQFVYPTPNETQHINTLPTLNCSHNSSGVEFYLYRDNVLTYDGISGNYTNGILFVETSMTEGNHNYTCYVQNTSSGIFSDTITRKFVYDTVNPTITINTNNGFKSDNSSIISNYLIRTLLLNITAADNNLYQILINITNSSGHTKYSNLTTITGYTAYNFTTTVDISSWELGNKYAKIYVSDTHTAEEWDSQYKTGLSYIEFNTPEENTVRITSNSLPLSKSVINEKDRKSYKFGYLFSSEENVFTLTSESPIIYLPESKETKGPHFVITKPGEIFGNWVDFDELDLKKEDYTVDKISDYEYKITIISHGKTEYEFKSIGGLNVAEIDSEFEIAAVINISAFDPILKKQINFTSILNGISKNSADYTNSTQYANISAGSVIIYVNSSGYDTTTTPFTVTGNFYEITTFMYLGNAVDDCSTYNQTILTVAGKDEETNADVNMSLDITFTHYSTSNVSKVSNTSLILRDRYNYSLCTNVNQTFVMNALMVYGDGTLYSKRLYYLIDYVANSSEPNIIYLYHLNNSLTTEIIFTVYDEITGDQVQDAYIKTIRYYPGENVYRVVEVTKTDESGQTVGKMRLSDIFYKFIIEKPAGTIRLNTEVLRMLTTTKAFGINFGNNYLDTFNKINDVSISTTCTKSTQTCRVTWSDSSNIVQDVTLEVWRSTGLKSELISTQTTEAAAGTIAYTIVEDTAGNTYEARSYIESNTGTSNYFSGSAGLIFSSNIFFTNNTDRIASLFPLFLLVVVIVFALIDFGVIGVTIGALLGLIGGSLIGILPISPFYFISFIVLAIILIYKLSK